MIFFGEDGTGSYRLPDAVKVEINSEFGVPADDMTVTFTKDIPLDIQRIYAVQGSFESLEAAMKVGAAFIGIVDEIELRKSSGINRIIVYARSMAALPLDNECEAGQYIEPTLEVMFRKHLAPFGITRESAYDVGARRTGGVMTAARGMSHWAAIAKYCGAFLGTVPRIGFTGEFRHDTYQNGDEVLFGSGGIEFSSASVRVNRCRRISRVYVQTSGGRVIINNESAQSSGIIRERRLDLSNSMTGTLSDGDSIIKKGESKALSATIECGRFLGDSIGRSARADIPELSDRQLYIYRTKYSEDAHGGRTSVVLCAREE